MQRPNWRRTSSMHRMADLGQHAPHDAVAAGVQRQLDERLAAVRGALPRPGRALSAAIGPSSSSIPRVSRAIVCGVTLPSTFAM